MKPLAHWQDLCLDAVDPEPMGRFWAEVIGLRVVPTAPPLSLDGALPSQRVWVNAVDRPHTVKNRVHLDVYARSVADLEARGATVLAPATETGLGWTVMADPEGNELCCFERPALPAYRLHGIGIDCVDAERQAAWWGEVLGVAPRSWEEGPWWTLEHATPDPVLTLDFDTVPEPRVGPNRVHWDLTGDVDAIVAHGATPLWSGRSWEVLADPEGNEFCVFPPEAG